MPATIDRRHRSIDAASCRALSVRDLARLRLDVSMRGVLMIGSRPRPWRARVGVPHVVQNFHAGSRSLEHVWQVAICASGYPGRDALAW